VPKDGLLQRVGQWLVFDDTAPDLTTSLGRILNAHWFFLGSTYFCKKEGGESK